MKRTGPTNPYLRKLLSNLRALAAKEKAAIWKTVANELEKPTRRRRTVNLSRLERHTSNGDVVLVPGKVLGAGMLTHKLTVAAWDYSAGAREAIKGIGGQAITIKQLTIKNPKGTKVKIIG